MRRCVRTPNAPSLSEMKSIRSESRFGDIGDLLRADVMPVARDIFGEEWIRPHRCSLCDGSMPHVIDGHRKLCRATCQIREGGAIECDALEGAPLPSATTIARQEKCTAPPIWRPRSAAPGRPLNPRKRQRNTGTHPRAPSQ